MKLLPLRRGHWQLELALWDMSSSPKFASIVEKVKEFSELKQVADARWIIDFGPIDNMESFRRTVWPVYSQIYRQLRAFCLKIYG